MDARQSLDSVRYCTSTVLTDICVSYRAVAVSRRYGTSTALVTRTPVSHSFRDSQITGTTPDMYSMTYEMSRIPDETVIFVRAR